jgi:hypothetical protein
VPISNWLGLSPEPVSRGVCALTCVAAPHIATSAARAIMGINSRPGRVGTMVTCSWVIATVIWQLQSSKRAAPGAFAASDRWWQHRSPKSTSSRTKRRPILLHVPNAVPSCCTYQTRQFFAPNCIPLDPLAMLAQRSIQELVPCAL